MEFFRQEYWKGSPFPPPGVIPEPGIEPVSPALQTDSLHAESLGKPAIIPTKTIHVCMGPFEGSCPYLHYLHNSLASGQITGREQPSQSTENWIKDLLSMALPISFPLSQSLPSGTFHKPLIHPHQRADRMKIRITGN